MPLQGQKCSEADCAAVHHWITQLALGEPERANTLRALSLSTCMHCPPAVSLVGKNNATSTASITPHTRCVFSDTLFYLPLPNWEWMSAHRGVENNGWGHLGTLSAKRHRDLCLPVKKTNMHIPLCGSQKLSNQCFCMGDNWINSQLCCQAFNDFEFESRIACTYRALLDRNVGKSNSHNNNVTQFVSLHTAYTNIARPQFWPTRLNMSLTHWLTYDSSLWTSLYLKFVMGNSCIVFLIGFFMFCRKLNMSNTFFIAC